MSSTCRIHWAKLGIYTVLVETSGGRRLLGRPGQSLENNIEKELPEI
jgi:hypothetical protein